MTVYCGNCKFTGRNMGGQLVCMFNPAVPYALVNQVPTLDPTKINVQVQIIAMRAPIMADEFCAYGQARIESELVK